MVSEQTIREMANSIVREFSPERIVLFGSYAYGTPTDDSDVDLLIVMPLPGRSRRMATEIALRVHRGFPLDVIVRSPAQLSERLALRDGFLTDILTRGRVLYAAAHG